MLSFILSISSSFGSLIFLISMMRYLNISLDFYNYAILDSRQLITPSFSMSCSSILSFSLICCSPLLSYSSNLTDKYSFLSFSYSIKIPSDSNFFSKLNFCEIAYEYFSSRLTMFFFRLTILESLEFWNFFNNS